MPPLSPESAAQVMGSRILVDEHVQDAAVVDDATTALAPEQVRGCAGGSMLVGVADEGLCWSHEPLVRELLYEDSRIKGVADNSKTSPHMILCSRPLSPTQPFSQLTHAPTHASCFSYVTCVNY